MKLRLINDLLPKFVNILRWQQKGLNLTLNQFKATQNIFISECQAMARWIHTIHQNLLLYSP